MFKTPCTIGKKYLLAFFSTFACAISHKYKDDNNDDKCGFAQDIKSKFYYYRCKKKMKVDVFSPARHRDSEE